MSGCHDDSVRKSSVTLLVNACCACSVEETGRVICGCPNGDKILPKLIQSRTCEKESRKHKIRCVESVRSDEQICNGLGSGDMLVKLLFQAELRPGQKLEKVRKTAFLGHIFVGSPIRYLLPRDPARRPLFVPPSQSSISKIRSLPPSLVCSGSQWQKSARCQASNQRFGVGDGCALLSHGTPPR